MQLKNLVRTCLLFFYPVVPVLAYLVTMSLLIRNLQKTVPLRRARLRRDVETLRQIFGIKKFDLGLICVDNRRIQRINEMYRGKNMPTDVLSFPFYEDLEAGKLPGHLCREELDLGDIFLGVEYIMEQCRDESRDFHSVLPVIVAHGICHLLGYRHETEEEWTQMFQKEKHILNEFSRLTGNQQEPLTKRDGYDT
ncbi:endoribonuclease YbeY-like [Conger conger]|uniref:endoribonuclease YbeY-like n=1 Tax=Conger conger TaxID=82655 RepID=UPI002A5A46E9|nr:endoribonuclease YbeY-like [Conger conger]